MVLFFEFACVFLIIQIGHIESSTGRELQQDVQKIIEVELGKSATLRFNDPFFKNDSFISNWTILGPYKTAIYMNSSIGFSDPEPNDIEKCILETDSSLTVILSKFGRHHAGIWRVLKEYRKIKNPEEIERKNCSFSVHGIEFDNKYHGKSFKIRDDEYIVMDFPEEYTEYSVCRLVKIEPSAVYDSIAELYRFPEDKTDIKQMTPCGFRMHVRNKSNGNWILVGRFGYIQKRAYFEVVIDSSISRLPKNLTKPLQFGWTGFPIKFELNIDLPYTYWELEKPDGNILNLRNKSSKYMDLVSITSDDNGTWIARAALNSDVYLTEQKFIIQISDFPKISSKVNFTQYDLYVDANFDYDFQLCIFTDKKGCIMGRKNFDRVDCHIREDKNSCYRWSFDTLGEGFSIEGLLSNSVPKRNFQLSHESSLQMPVINFAEFGNFKLIWHSLQTKKYVAYGESFELKFSCNTLIKKCELMSPNEEVYIQRDYSLIINKNYCKAFVKNATSMHTGNWTWSIDIENIYSSSVKSTAPVEVLESHAIPQIRPSLNSFSDVLLICESSPMTYYKKVRYYEWLRPDEVRLSENDSVQYNENDWNNTCNLAMLGSSEKYSGIWKCIARVDEYSKDEIYATLNVSEKLFEDIKLPPRNKKVGDIIEVELWKNAELTFNDPVPMKEYSLSNWEIRGPYKTTECEMIKSGSFNNRGKYIQECVAETNSSLTVKLSQFKKYHAGKWSVRSEYRENGYGNINSTETSFSVLGIEYDNTYNGKLFKMKDGEYFVMLFEEKFPKYSICRLVKKETNTSYDLDAEPHIFSSSKADIQRLNSCGFRMHLGNTSHGNWSLIGRYGWIEKRANFEVFIESSIIQQPRITKSLILFDGFSEYFETSVQYVEYETPDGNLLRLGDKHLVTTSSNGIWIRRKEKGNQSSLQEVYFRMKVLDLPQVSHELEQVNEGLYNLYVNVSLEYSIDLELKNKDGEIFWSNKNSNVSADCSIREDINCVFDCETLCRVQQFFVFENFTLSDDSIGEEMEISFEYYGFHVKAFIDPHVSQESIQYPSHLWYSVQRKKYVTRNEKLEVKCIASAPLTNCTLKSPRSETYIPGYHSLITSKNCSEIGGNCGCIAIIENVTDIHAGNWTCNMIFEDGLKVESLVPVQVLESYLIPAIVISSGKMKSLLLCCKLSPMYEYKKIRSCEWFGPNGVQVNKSEFPIYTVNNGDKHCDLLFLGSGKQHSGIWKCVAHLDTYLEDVVYATLNVSEHLFENTEPKRRNGSWPFLLNRPNVIFEDDGAAHVEMNIFIAENTESRFCTVKDQNGESTDASKIVNDEFPGWAFQLNIPINPEKEVIQKWEISLDNEEGISTSIKAQVEGFELITKNIIDFWHDVPKMSVLKHGSIFERSYRARESLQYCTLKSPTGLNYNQQTRSDKDPVQVGMDKGGFSCRIFINSTATDHSGIWFFGMKTTTGLESRDPFPIQVIESYIVLEAERELYQDGNIKLHCRIRTMMHEKKIRNCKWFRPDGVQILIKESTKYNATEDYDVCTLELKDPNENDFGIWNCSAGLDGHSDENIAILNLSRTFSTANKHYKKREIRIHDGLKAEYSKLRMMIGDAVELICSASVRNFRDRLEWHYSDSERANASGRIKIYDLPRTTTHYRTMLSINPTLRSDNKTFICSTKLRGNHADTINVSTSYEIEFRDVAPLFVDTNMNKTKWSYNVNMTNPEHIILKCYADGLPKPVIVWKKNGVEIEGSNKSWIDLCNATFLNQSQELHIHALDVKCGGHYLCHVVNHIDWTENYQTIFITQKNNSTVDTITESSLEDSWVTILIVSIFTLICVSLVICYCLFDRIRLKKKITEVESAMRLDETRLGPLNPDEMLHEQADFLPYDEKRWEYPEEDLEIGEQLGRGFFGIVMKAKAPNIHKDGNTPTVAVKKMHSYSLFTNERRALNIELRILANLEKHPNVVNLLGACTKRAAIGHLIVILEYCPLGNLLDYLRQNFSAFIDQIDPLSRTIDFPKKKQFGIHQISSVPDISQELIVDNSVITKSDAKNNSKNLPSNEIVPNECQVQPRDNEKASNNNHLIRLTASINMYTLTPVKDVANDHEELISTQNLLEWASQIACAMEYLSRKKILHGDLAARNILLTGKRIAKICDFGLSRTIPDGHYYKNIDAVMPVKWMAIESIEKRKFSSQSDVWSFGIVLWECFTLGKDPYDGLNLKELIALLNNGSRLEMPTYATQAIYDIMLRCWNLLPEDRPSFSELFQDIEKISNCSMKGSHISD